MGVAVWIRKDDDAKEVLTRLFSSFDKMRDMKVNARLLAKRNSCKDICEIIFK